MDKADFAPIELTYEGLFWEGKESDLEQIQPQIEKRILGNADFILMLCVDPELNYGDYLMLKSTLSQTYKSMRTNYSVETFRKPFDALTEQEKMEVMSRFPIRILEVPPEGLTANLANGTKQ